MDTIAGHLRKASKHVTVPRSVPGLVTDRLLVMEFVEGVPLMQVGRRGSGGRAPASCMHRDDIALHMRSCAPLCMRVRRAASAALLLAAAAHTVHTALLLNLSCAGVARALHWQRAAVHAAA